MLVFNAFNALNTCNNAIILVFNAFNALNTCNNACIQCIHALIYLSGALQSHTWEDNIEEIDLFKLKFVESVVVLE